MGNSRVGKTHLGHGVDTDGMPPVYRGQFCIAASAVNDLIQVQEDHRCAQVVDFVAESHRFRQRVQRGAGMMECRQRRPTDGRSHSQGWDNAVRCPECPQPRRRSGLVFDHHTALSSIVKVQVKYPKWPSFRSTNGLVFARQKQRVFGDERLTAALLDWLTHRAHTLEFVAGIVPVPPVDTTFRVSGGSIFDDQVTAFIIPQS